ncbi:MAG TPA: sigma-54 dependent transcriptional regulator [Bryobacteraceae bacterium]|nr:sigma-54 dependent transcriptional regulator [Bryobacteraceae bacterium]
MPPNLQAQSYLGMPAIVSSPGMRQLIELAERIAQSNAAVLITGESGSGKELIARAVHHYSLRCAKPWVDVSCAALPEHLVESELFGYEKGAFSGADSPKPGLFELAHHGTLFLDEVGELEPRMQVKLLRVLDGVAYYRLGGTRKVTVDVRIVAATNQDLEHMVDTGSFRGDLYHRLGQICLRVPPLRERGEDIVPLAEHFLKQTNSRLHFSQGALDILQAHRWPGNVRELRNVVTKAAVLSREIEIGAADLLLAPPRVASVATPMPSFSSTVSSGAPSENLDGMEKTTILRVLAQTNGHQQKAAELLGISRRTLSRKLKLYGREAVRQSYAS